jgi:hypothetical protein
MKDTFANNKNTKPNDEKKKDAGKANNYAQKWVNTHFNNFNVSGDSAGLLWFYIICFVFGKKQFIISKI